jgi:manganese transport protein
MYPLIRLTGRADVMGDFVNSRGTALLAWALFTVISLANLWLVLQAFGLA